MVMVHLIVVVHTQVNIYPAIYVILCVGEKNSKNEDRLQLFCNKTVLFFFINVTYNKTIILLNLVEYPLIIANSDYRLVGYRIHSINCPGRSYEGGRLFEGGRLLFSQHFQQARTFLDNNKTRDKKNKAKQSAKSNMNE